MSAPEKNVHPLNKRERDCLLWTARGKTYMEISMILGVAYATVKTYLDAARYKLNSSSVAQATARAVALGILTPDDLADDEETLRRDPARSVVEGQDKAQEEIDRPGDKEHEPAPVARGRLPEDQGEHEDEHP
jgi:DNA-binding CsgD family transcriptional regulator